MELKHIFSKALFQLHQLLIVPYGIETSYINERIDSLNTFNRTLWN